VAQRSVATKALLDKIVPFQGIFGFVIFIWGIWVIIQLILDLGLMGLAFPRGLILWLTILVDAVLSLAGGAILGWGLIQKHLLSKAPDNVKAKAEESFARIVALQPKIGIAAIVFGFWVIIANVLLIRV
jgi:hypothetical protein